MKVGEIETENIAQYLRLEEFDEDEMEAILNASKAFIQSYTGLTDKEIDEHEDFYIVVLILCQDMYDNRCMYVDKNNLNKVVSTILDMHCVNLL